MADLLRGISVFCTALSTNMSVNNTISFYIQKIVCIEIQIDIDSS